MYRAEAAIKLDKNYSFTTNPLLMKPALPAAHTPLHRWLCAAALASCCITSAAAWAQDADTEDKRSVVSLTGILGDKALLIVNGSAPKAVATGDTFQKVQVISVKDGQAQVRIDGQMHTLRMGESPAHVGVAGTASSGSGRIVLRADRSGHFMSPGMINGKSTRFMVDTGASAISLGKSEAHKLGINYQNGRTIRTSTANGIGQGWHVKLDSVRIADVELRNIDAIVTSSDMPFVLLGNNYLNSFQMTRLGQQLTLERVK